MTEAPIVLRLCSHAQTVAFKSGDSVLDLNLRMYVDRFANGDESLVYALARQYVQVVGYISLVDLVVEWNDASFRLGVVAALAVAQDDHPIENAARLVLQISHIIEARQRASRDRTRNDRYDAIACSPRTDDMIERVERRGFRPVTILGQRWWLKPGGL